MKKGISLIACDFSPRVAAEEIENWKKEIQTDFRGEIAQGMPEGTEGVFLVTDSIERCLEAKKRGIPYLLYLHDGNREESFEEIPFGITALEGIDIYYLDKVYRRFRNLPWIILETERCMVRELTEDDLDQLYEIYRDPAMVLYTEGLYEDREKERAYIRDYREKVYGFYGYGVWAVILKETGRLIGRAGLSGREGFDTPELGYAIGVAYQKKGYGTEVCKAILDYAVSELGFEKIRVLFAKENQASLALCRKLGFQKDRETETEGVMMWQYVYQAGQRENGRENIEQ